MRSPILFVIALLLIPVAALAQTKAAASKYVGYTYSGVRPETLLPNGVKHLGGGLVGDFDANPVYGISRVTKGTTTMLWLEVSTGRDVTGITGWRVLDALTFPALRATQHLAYAVDPAIGCMRNGKELTDDTVMIGQVFRKLGVYKPEKVWTANLKTGKFESSSVAGLKCTYSEP
jgi:hypothetical protein